MGSPPAVVAGSSRPPGPVDEEEDLMLRAPSPAEVALLGRDDLVAIEALHSHPETRDAFIAPAKGGARG